jgi:hypothetical protein
MANTIRIPRSVSTNTPASLAQGELAYSETGSPNGFGELFIGTAGPAVTKLTTTVLTGTDGVAAQPNASAQDNQSITTGLGIDGAEAGSTGNITISFDPNELTATALAATDWLVFEDATDSAPKKSLLSTTNLSLFNDDLGHVENAVHTGDVIGGTVLTIDALKVATGMIQADAVTYAKIQNVVANNVFLGNNAGAGAIVDELTGTEATALLDPFATAATTQGVVPGSNSLGATYYLDGSGAWSVPPGGAASNSFATITVDDTDTEYTWAELGSVVADSSSDTLTVVSGIGIDIDSDAALDALRIAANFSSLPVTVPVTGDWIAFDDAGVSSKALISAIPLSIFSNDSGWTSNAGTVTSVAGGTGVSSTGGATPSIALTVDELAEKTGAVVGTDRLVGTTATTNWAETISGIPLSVFNNDSGWEANDADTVLTTSTGAASWNWILDEDAMGSDSDTHVPTQQSVKAYVDAAVTGGLTHKGGYNASTNTPALDTGSPVLVIGDMYTVTVAGTFFTVELEVGDVLIADVDSVDAASVADWTIVQANIGASSETVAGYIELATQAEMDTATDDLRAVTPLKYANSTIDGGTF